jgi:hypothetical protein
MSENTSRGLTAVTPVPEKAPAEPRVRVFLPLLETSEGAKVDQYEHVTVGGKTDLVKRGEHVEVTVPTFLQLKHKYPHL